MRIRRTTGGHASGRGRWRVSPRAIAILAAVTALLALSVLPASSPGAAETSTKQHVGDTVTGDSAGPTATPSAGKHGHGKSTTEHHGGTTGRADAAAGAAAHPTERVVPNATTPLTTEGTDFWVAFEVNYEGGSDLYLFAAGNQAASGTVSAPAADFSTRFTVAPGTVATIQLPSNAQDATNDTVSNYGIHVTSTTPVSIYGLNTEQFTTDGFLGIPTPLLGNSYVVESYTSDGSNSQFEAIATQNDTTVTITPSVNTTSHSAGVPYTETLNAGQTYQLGYPTDLTGTTVTANRNIAVFAGSACANVPESAGYCNTLTEEMTPVSSWGQSFLTEPLATRAEDTFRVLASEDDTSVKINGTTVATLGADQFYETDLSSASSITSNKPVHVMQYSQGSTTDGADSDPFDITVTPFAQFLNSYVFSTEPDGADPAIHNNYVNIVAPTSSVTTIKLDGATLSAKDFAPIGSSGFSGAQVHVDFGSHTLTGNQPFGLTVYGNGDDDGYGFPGGFTLSPIATVSHVALSLSANQVKVRTPVTATATVTDQNGRPVPGVRVDFTITGANAQSGFAYADGKGDAQFTYTPAEAGNDSVQAAVGSVLSPSRPVTVTATARTVTAVDDFYTTRENRTLTVGPAAGVLANDSSADGDPLSASLQTTTAHGTLHLDTDGGFSYVPKSRFVGRDSFVYVALDQHGEDTLSSIPAVVTITVSPAGVLLVTTNDRYRTRENETLSIGRAAGVLANDTVPAGTSVGAVLGRSPARGSLALNRDGSFTYRPHRGFVGTDGFTYRAVARPSVSATGAAGRSLTSRLTTVTIVVFTPGAGSVEPNPVNHPGSPTGSSTPPTSGEIAGGQPSGTTPSGTTPSSPTPTYPSTPSPAPAPAPTPGPPVLTRIPNGIALSSPSVNPGGSVTASGRGCAAFAHVALTIDGRAAGQGTANGQGAFRVALTTPRLAIGNHQVVATCGDHQLLAPISFVYVTSTSGTSAAQSLTIAAVFAFFLLFLGLALRRPGS